MSEDAVTLQSASSASVQAGRDELADRKAHVAELEQRVQRDDVSPEKMATYRAALEQARADINALEKE